MTVSTHSFKLNGGMERISSLDLQFRQQGLWTNSGLQQARLCAGWPDVNGKEQSKDRAPEQLPESGLKNIKSYYVAQHSVAVAFENKCAILFMLEWAGLEDGNSSQGPFVSSDYAIQPCPHALCRV